MILFVCFGGNCFLFCFVCVIGRRGRPRKEEKKEESGEEDTEENETGEEDD